MKYYATFLFILFFGFGCNHQDAGSNSANDNSDSSVVTTGSMTNSDTLFLSFCYGLSEQQVNQQIEKEIASGRLERVKNSDEAILEFTFSSGIISLFKPIFLQDSLRRIMLTPYDHVESGYPSTKYYSISEPKAKEVTSAYVDKYGKYDSTIVEEVVGVNLSGTQKKKIITKYFEWEAGNKRISISIYYGIEDKIEMNIYYLLINSDPPSKWKLREKEINDSIRNSLELNRKNSV
jgi:hypothetical protein